MNNITRILKASLLAIICFFLTANFATAVGTFYTDEATFLSDASSAGVLLNLESFETATGSAPITIGDITISNTGSSSVEVSMQNPTDGTQTIGWGNSGNGSITYNFANPINAFGIDVLDLGTVGATDLTLTTTTGSTLLFDDFTGSRGNQLFGGYIDLTQSFTSVTFGNADSGDAVYFDRLQYGAVVPIIVDPYNSGSTDVIVDPGGANTLLTNPVANPLNVTDLSIGNSGNGLILVGGTGVVDVTDDLIVGRVGGSNGTLNITNGGTVTSDKGRIADFFTSTGTVTVSGSNGGTDSSWTLTDYLRVGDSGNGTLMITDGADVTNAEGFIGWGGSVSAKSEGTVTVDGSGSTWTNTDILYVGYVGKGTLNVTGGGVVTASELTIVGNGISGSTGEVNVDGSGSQIILDGIVSYFGVGGNGFTDATLNVTNGGVISQSNPSSPVREFRVTEGGTATVDGAGSRVENYEHVRVGESGIGSLLVSSGGVVSGEIGSVGWIDAGIGLVTVDGLGSTWENSDSLYIGGSEYDGGGTGTLTIQNQGTVTVVNETKLWSSDDTITIDGGTFITGSLDNSNGGTVDFISGTFEVQNYIGDFVNQGTFTVDNLVGDLTNQGGTISPGNSPGITSIEGSFNQISGIVDIELGGLIAGTEFDYVNVTSSVSLSGDLNVSLINGFMPSLGDSFEIITGSSLSGTFTNENLPSLPSPLSWQTEYDALTGTVTLSVIEPSSEDLNDNGYVDSLDLGILLGNWGSSTTPDQGELDGTPPVDSLDLGLLLAAWNPPPLAAAAQVPEPTTLLLTSLGFVSMIASRRKVCNHEKHLQVALAFLPLMFLSSLLITETSLAGTIRADIADGNYTNYAQSPGFNPTGELSISATGGGSLCSGTLIASDWVLTAAHCVDNSDGNVNSVFFGDLNSTFYSASNWIIHPSWNGTVGDGFDIALVQLNNPVTGIQPALRYNGSSELGDTGNIVGYGRTGNGLTGDIASSGDRRAGDNVIDAVDTDSSGANTILLTDFDNHLNFFFPPGTWVDNEFGQPFPLSLEYQVAPGDSGGSLYIERSGYTYLTGVTSYRGATDGNIDSDYGDQSGFTRVTSFNSWINQNVGGIHWVGSSGNIQTRTNWSTQVPTASDDVIFSLPGQHTIGSSGGDAQFRDATIDYGDYTFTDHVEITDDIIIGNKVGNSASVVLDGSSSELEVSDVTAVGYRGIGTLDIDGGKLTTGDDLYIGRFAGAIGLIIVDGANGELRVGDAIYVDFETGSSGTLQVNSGAGVQASRAIINSGGRIDTIGSGKLLLDATPNISFGNVDAGDTYVGHDSTGMMTINDGYSTIYDDLVVGRNASSNGTVTLNGLNAVLNVGDFTHVGYSGTGTLTINDGSFSTSDDLVIGRNAGSDGTITTSGTLDVGSDLSVGGLISSSGGTGLLDIQAGETNVNAELKIWSTGTLTVSGGTLTTGSLDNSNGGDLNHNDGTITIDGGTFDIGSDSDYHIEGLGAGHAILTLKNGATWDPIGGVTVARGNTGTLNVESGANVDIPADFVIGRHNLGATGTVNVTDLGSNITVDGLLQVGSFETGFLNISQGANVEVNNDVYIGRFGSAANGTAMLSSGGSLSSQGDGMIAATTGSSGSATVTDTNSAWTTSSLYIGGDSLSNGGSGSLTIQNSGSVSVSGTIKLWSSDDTLSLSGGSLTTNTLENTGGGTFDFTGGTLAVGTFDGDLTNQGGILSSGSPVGTTNVTGMYDQQSGVLDIELGGLIAGTEFDYVNVTSSVSLSGDLNVSLINGFMPSLGDSFEIITGSSLSGTFTNENLPMLPGPLTWNTEYDTLNGTVTLSVMAPANEDLNGDGFVDSIDLGLLLGSWGTSTTPDQGELDGTPPVDSLDLGLLLAAWNPPPLAAAAQVPEPTALLLSSLGFVGLLPHRRASNP